MYQSRIKHIHIYTYVPYSTDYINIIIYLTAIYNMCSIFSHQDIHCLDNANVLLVSLCSSGV